MKSVTRVLVLAVVLLSTGCLGVPPTAEQTQTTTSATATPTPAAPISDEEAIERATTYHEAQIRDNIDDDEYDVGRPTTQVTNRAENGVYVEVEQGYSRTSDGVRVNHLTESKYFVNETTIRQIY
ncbi:hypothetical protein GJR96_03910 [Haloferax sp. MBLA0076]|uniref:Lipoprotein n=1 Tax=Haloferax litoreum TaxID=2666140 RepID=A0A6A8GF26_9EURY|nr:MULTISPECIES: hypothetical protein [Haloferax]KAB1192628.1 hypothetical protein Hfx1148_03905 [Haloferax sp. CBA1148]MRX21102.1 hypothetical protein [Haloferax litoreum]